jgi:hypothetical protein
MRGYNILFPIYSQDMAVCSEEAKKIFSTRLTASLLHQKDDKAHWYFTAEEFGQAGKYLLEKLQEKEFFEELKQKIESSYEEMKEFIKQLPERTDLIKTYKEYVEILTRFRALAIIPNIVSWGEYTIIDNYRKLLSKKLTEEEFTKLTTPKEISEELLSKKELLETEDVEAWIKKWGYIYYYYKGPLPTKEEVKDIIEELKKNDVNKKIEEINNYTETIRKEKEELTKKLSLNEKDQHLLKVISYLMFYKLERKLLMQKSYLALDTIFEKFSEQTGLTIDQLKFLTIEETEQLLKTGQKPLPLIKEREKEILYAVFDDKLHIIP